MSCLVWVLLTEWPPGAIVACPVPYLPFPWLPGRLINQTLHDTSKTDGIPAEVDSVIASASGEMFQTSIGGRVETQASVTIVWTQIVCIRYVSHGLA